MTMKMMALGPGRRKRIRTPLQVSIDNCSLSSINLCPCVEAKAMAEKAMKDPMSLVNNVGALKFW